MVIKSERTLSSNNEEACKMVNVILPTSTIGFIAKVPTGKRSRSRFIDEAVRSHISRFRCASLKKRLRVDAQANTDFDLALSEEWEFLEEETWAEIDAQEEDRKRLNMRIRRVSPWSLQSVDDALMISLGPILL